MPSGKLIPNLHEKFGAVIWKIEIDERMDLIAIETRDVDNHKALFSVFNYSTGECYIKEKSTENSWWWGLDRIHNSILYLYGYKSEGSPEHKGIIAWDAQNAEIKWEKFNYTLDGILSDGLIVHNSLLQSSKHELLSPETGESIKTGIENYTIPERKIFFPSTFRGAALPFFIPQDTVGVVLTLDYNGKSIWSYHIKSDSGYTQKLIITENSEIIVTENLATDIQKLNPEAFFIQKNHLFCIRHSNYEIVSYLI